ncbi:MAG: aldo/keto reductase [Chloroflexi bacterium]|nr:aldo/keto reductase [Chloroflexota bacterium]
MNYRELGGTGLQVSEIGFGCGGNAGLMVKGTPEQQREAVSRAPELGINYFDQAPDYGDGVSETNLGRVLKDLGAQPYITSRWRSGLRTWETSPATSSTQRTKVSLG